MFDFRTAESRTWFIFGHTVKTISNALAYFSTDEPELRVTSSVFTSTEKKSFDYINYVVWKQITPQSQNISK
jgi:hypothetical protein